MDRLQQSLMSAWATVLLALPWPAFAVNLATKPCAVTAPCTHEFMAYVDLKLATPAQSRSAIASTVDMFEAALGKPITELRESATKMRLYGWQTSQNDLQYFLYIAKIETESRGHQAEPEDFPFSWKVGDRTNQSCGATAISKRRLLTAAHCIDMTASYGARVGSSVVGLTCRRHKDYGPHCSDLSPDKDGACWADVAICDTDGSDLTTKFAEPVQDYATALTSITGLGGCGWGPSSWTSKLSWIPLTSDAQVPKDSLIFVARTIEEVHKVCHGDSGSGVFSQANSQAKVAAIISKAIESGRKARLVRLGNKTIWEFVTSHP